MSTKVSIIIPTYNYGQYIQRAVDSALIQTYPNIEVLVVDDGSTDDTEEVVKAYGERIRYFKQDNQGVSAARNFGFSQAKGEYILFLDADDWLKPDAIQHRANLLDKQPNYGWVYGPCCYEDIKGNDVTSDFDESKFAYRKQRQGDVLQYMLMGELIHTPAIMLRRDVLEDVGLFDVQLHNLEDYNLWVRVALKYQVGFVPTVDVVCVTHADSASHVNAGGYGSLLRTLQYAAKEKPNVIRRLGWAWSHRLAEVMAGHAAQLLLGNEKKNARRWVLRAIRKRPFTLYYYGLWLKTLL